MKPLFFAFLYLSLSAPSAFARGNASVSAGKTLSHAKQTSPASSDLGDSNGMSLTAAGSWRVWDALPVGIGGFYTTAEANGTGPSGTQYKSSTKALGPALEIYLSLTVLDVYLSAGYAIGGDSIVKATKSSSDAAGSGVSETIYDNGTIGGSRVSGGIAYPLALGLTVKLEYTYDNQTIELRQSKVTRADDGSSARFDLSANPVYLNSISRTAGLGLGYKF